MLEGDKIKVAQGENPCYLLLNQANRHGSLRSLGHGQDGHHEGAGRRVRPGRRACVHG